MNSSSFSDRGPSSVWLFLVGCCALLAALSANRLHAQSIPPVPSLSVIGRVMQIQYSTNFSTGLTIAESTNYGTAFTIDVEGKQYLITAGHIVSGIGSNDVVLIKPVHDWISVQVNSIPVNTNADLAVLAPPYQITRSMLCPAAIGGFGLGQDMFFLGYPYGLSMPSQDLTMPFLKKGILSAWMDDTNGTTTFFLDGHNNPGFSGGPIVFRPMIGSQNWQICGVVKAYRFERKMVLSATETNAYVKENAGIVIGEGIKAALDGIKARPIGAAITNAEY
jgi:hypothetical protein